MWNRTGWIVEAGQTETTEIAVDGMPCRSVLLAKIAGTAGFSAVVSVEVSPDEGTTWFVLPFVNLTGNSDVALVDSVTLAASGSRAIAGLNWVPRGAQIRVKVVDSTEDATLDLWLVKSEDEA